MQIRNTVKGVAHLRRLHNKLGAIITWEVLNLDKTIRVGIIESRYSAWLSKRIGWQEFPVRYWIGHKFYKQKMFVGNTRDDVIRQMMEMNQ